MVETPEAQVAIVGAGPIGLELAVALKKAGISYFHFDAKQIGYTISWYPPQTRFFSSNERIAIAGVPLQTSDQNKATREEYLTYLRRTVQQFDLHVNTYEPIVGIRRIGGRFELTSRPAGGERTWQVENIVLATGGTDHPRRLNVPGEDLPHVSHYFDDPHKYFRKRVLVVGGKNSAVEAALRCHHAGAYVSLSYRRQQLPEKSIKYWLMPEMGTLISSGRIQAHFDTLVERIMPTSVLLRLGSLRGGAAIEVEADFVLLLTGYTQDTRLFELAGLQLSEPCRAPVHDPQTMMTSVPGIYVAGTAVGGTQEKYTVFIENCHIHVDRILAALSGSASPAAPVSNALPES